MTIKLNSKGMLKSKHAIQPIQQSHVELKHSNVKLKYSPALSAVWIAVAVMATGCSASKSPHYYSLTPQVTPTLNGQVRVIEVLPVGLADRLNRIPLVVQEVNGKSNVLNDERWTSTLSAELRDGLSAGLQQKLGAVDRYNSGMTGGKAAYRIAADFSHFDILERPLPNANKAERPREVAVAVAWTIKYDDPNRALTTVNTPQHSKVTGQLSCRMTFNQSVVSNSNPMVDTVNTLRQSLSRVVDAVAASVLAVEGKSRVSVADVTCA
ncbi:PqiC family protein [Acinetobacter sp. TGL-Y2]|uniref:PqiC family protein n=1 Tax=Acinetobacter sp. TGL-Y2 TaxID=1407071 RepID=UPI000B31B560|nr:ABC-type transport auxiliary lipoprotein family protein [Acinetobacter sp. TGL-Y2]